jgi:hypothetical protein
MEYAQRATCVKHPDDVRARVGPWNLHVQGRGKCHYSLRDHIKSRSRAHSKKQSEQHNSNNDSNDNDNDSAWRRKRRRQQRCKMEAASIATAAAARQEAMIRHPTKTAKAHRIRTGNTSRSVLV